MGGLKKYLPVTFATMMIGTLAIAGIPPFSGFFSKDEILLQDLRAQQGAVGAGGGHGADDRVLHVPADVDDVLRGVSRPGVGARGARRRTATRTGTTRATGTMPMAAATTACRQADGHGGHGAWHGPHESPKAMTVPLHGAGGRGGLRRVRRHSGVPAAAATPSSTSWSRASRRASSHGRRRSRGGGAHAAAPAEHAAAPAATRADAWPPHAAAARRTAQPPRGHGAEAAAHGVSHGAEMGLMVFSVLVAVTGIAVARHILPDAAGDRPSRLARALRRAAPRAAEQVLRGRVLRRDGRRAARHGRRRACRGCSTARSSTAR